MEQRDRATVSKLVQQGHFRSLIMVCCPPTPLQKAKRPCSHTSCPFQIQYCRIKVICFLLACHTILGAWLGRIGAKIPSRQLFSEPYFLVGIPFIVMVSVKICLRLFGNVRCVSFIPLLWTWRKCITEMFLGRSQNYKFPLYAVSST